VSTKQPLRRFEAPTQLKLALMWIAVMFLYIYNDYFNMYLPGGIEGMMSGELGPFDAANDAAMVGVSIMMAIPALMVFLSVALPPFASRWLNVVFGVIYTVIEAWTFTGAELFFQVVVVMEIVLTLLVVLSALRWPRGAASG
jgi:hypothetical protein